VEDEKMKLQVRNGSFGKVLVAATIAFMTSLASPAQAQPGQWVGDNCFYVKVANPVMPSGQPGSTQLVRKGCVVESDGRKFYYDIGSKIVTDFSTNRSYFVRENGHVWVYQIKEWVDTGRVIQSPGSTEPDNQRGEGCKIGEERSRKSGLVSGKWDHLDEKYMSFAPGLY
jgi:hypothetical protein